jgi:hypothetical protein
VSERDIRVTALRKILIESPTAIKLFRSENCSGFGFRELVSLKQLTLYNLLAQANREMPVRYPDRGETDNGIREEMSLQIRV